MINLTFDTAYTELEKIIRLIEGENIPLDELAEKATKAATAELPNSSAYPPRDP